MKEDKFQRTLVIPTIKRIPHLKVAFIMNETGRNSKAHGQWKKDMGILPGHSDLIVYDLKNMKTDYIELKGYSIGKKGQYIGMGKQSDNQCAFESMVNYLGHDYYLIRNPDELNEYIKEKLA